MEGFLTQKKLLITSKNYDQAIEIKDGSVQMNGELHMSPLTENEEQLFILYKVDENYEYNKIYYYITNLKSELLLTVNGKKIIQTSYQNINEQKFQFVELPNGNYIIQQKGSENVLEVQQSNDKMMLSVNKFTYGYSNQLFTLKESLRMFDKNPNRFLVDYIGQVVKFQLVPNVPIHIQCVNSNLYIDVYEQSLKQNTQLVQWSRNYQNNQLFILEKIKKVEQLEQNQILNSLQQQNNGNDILNQQNQNLIQQNLINSHYENIFYIRCLQSNLYWTIQDKRITDGGILVQDQLQPYQNNSHQRFIIQVLVNGNVHIQPFHSKKYLDVDGDSHQCGAQIIQFHKQCQLNQQFRINYE